jgi:radical SAM superfamily enzyme YgiQ (UPF0313 family)
MNKITDNQAYNREPGKILLALLPFWDPLIPPQGIACLKSFLQGHGYRVTTKAANMERRFLVLYSRYFDVIEKIVPENRLDVLFHLGHFVLQNHMMAHINYKDEHEYNELVRELVYKNFYVDIPGSHVSELNQILIEFYRELENYFLDILAKETPDVLGLSVYKATLPASLFVFKLTRQRYPYIRTIMGGGIFADHLAEKSPNLEFFQEKAKDYVDKIFIGQGELLLLKYLRGELPPGQSIYTLKDLNGQVLDFAAAGLPDYSDFNLNQHQNISLGATASTGCKFQCSFCNEVKFFGKFRKKDPAQTAREMMALYREYGYQLFFMTDAMLNPVIFDLAAELIDSGVTLYYDSYLRVDRETADIENTLLWRRGGFYRARLGVESGSQRVLDLIGKGITPGQIKAAVSGLAYAGIKTTTYWVIGHPGETEDDFRQTLDLVTQLKNDLWQAECAPFDYYYSGQAHSDRWAPRRKLLYPENAKDLLIAQTWILDLEPSREETYRRLFRFTEHCRKLGIPNPYSINEIHSADQRWRKLHKNAVPPLLDFQKRNFIDDTGKVKKLNFVLDKWQDQGDFVF